MEMAAVTSVVCFYEIAEERLAHSEEGILESAAVAIEEEEAEEEEVMVRVVVAEET